MVWTKRTFHCANSGLPRVKTLRGASKAGAVHSASSTRKQMRHPGRWPQQADSLALGTARGEHWFGSPNSSRPQRTRRAPHAACRLQHYTITKDPSACHAGRRNPRAVAANTAVTTTNPKEDRAAGMENQIQMSVRHPGRLFSRYWESKRDRPMTPCSRLDLSVQLPLAPEGHAWFPPTVPASDAC